MDNKKYVFVYGTLMRNYRNHGYMNDSAYIGDGSIDGFEIYDLGTYPGIIEGKGVVLGEVYQITEDTEKRLDFLEEEGSLYLKKQVNVRVDDNQTITAFVYVYNKDVSGCKKLDCKYL